ncbi:MAG: hypothetical protein ACRDRH_18930 [Pseudonocardia sp.]
MTGVVAGVITKGSFGHSGPCAHERDGDRDRITVSVRLQRVVRGALFGSVSVVRFAWSIAHVLEHR